MKKLNYLIASLAFLLLFSAPVFAEGPDARVNYMVHVSNVGWQDPVGNAKTAGTTGELKDVEAIEITDAGLTDGSDILYRAYVENEGWQDYVSNGEMAGTTGKNEHIEALQIKLSGPVGNLYDVYYRVHTSNIGWFDWAKNDQLAGTKGFDLAIEAVEISFVEKGSPAPGKTEKINLLPETLRENCNVSYASLADGADQWQATVSNGQDSGTPGQDLAIDSLVVSLTGMNDGGVNYRVSTISSGWNDWVKDQAEAGKPGNGNTIEAVQMTLYGKLMYFYDIYYQAYSSDVGWEGWAKNGQIAGSRYGTGKLQAFRVYILPKSIVPPNYDSKLDTYVRYDLDLPQSVTGKAFAYVSIPKQTLMYFNDQHQLVFQTPVVTGQIGDEDSETPTGDYIMTRKAKDVTLVGSTYTQPVDYWIPFIDELYGVHDAERWRSPGEFGGRTYQNNGSHGCINLPLQAMGTFYNIMSPGDPIIIR